MKKSLSLKLLTINLVMIIVCTTSIAVASYFFHRSDTVNENAARALDIARTALSHIDGDKFEETMETREKNSHWQNAKVALDEIKVATGITFLYAMDNDYTDTHVTFFAAGFNPNADWDDPRDLGDQDAILTEDGEPYFSELMFETIKTGEDRKTGIYNVVGQKVISAFTPIKNSDGVVVGVLGVDLNVAEALSASRIFAIKMAIMAALASIVLGLISYFAVKKIVSVPITSLTEATMSISEGDININMNINTEDEIGILADSIKKMAVAFQDQENALSQMSTGDFTVSINRRGDKDSVNRAINDMAGKINDSISEIRTVSGQVSKGSSIIAKAAQDLTVDTNGQASAIEQLSQSMNDILLQAEKNTKESEEALQYVKEVGEFMAESMNSMNNMIVSMGEIDSASKAISQIMTVIDSIAFQTNILSLNAAVEAARAGEAGKGFAVVANEVNNLALKSAEAAKETADFIQNSIDRVSEGSKIADETNNSLKSAVELTNLCTSAVEKINSASKFQTNSISEINNSVEQISLLIKTITNKSEQSALTAEEMRSQSDMLINVVSRFVINE